MTEEVYIIGIYFKNNTTEELTVRGAKTFPIYYRKFYNWYFNRDSKSYCFRYSDGGMLIINRDEISKIKFYKTKQPKIS